MKKLTLVLLILAINFSYAQSKKELIDELIKSNFVQLDYSNWGNEFGLLLEKITEKELVELSKNENSIIRTYAKLELIENGKGNILSLLKEELEKSELIEVFDACLRDKKTTPTIIYETFFTKKSLDTLSHFKNIGYSAIDSIVVKDKIFKKIDSTIIYSNADLNHSILNSVFKRRYNESYLPQIERLAFEMNIFGALFYLMENYKKEYSERIEEYFTEVFPNVKFETYNKMSNLIHYLNYLLESENKVLYNAGIKRLKKQEWKNHDLDITLEKLIQEKRIKI